jgi:hypothetical protein
MMMKTIMMMVGRRRPRKRRGNVTYDLERLFDTLIAVRDGLTISRFVFSLEFG